MGSMSKSAAVDSDRSLEAHGSGHGMPSLLVKYSESSSRLPPRFTPEIFAAISAGPSFALMK